MPENSTDIEYDNINKRYQRRPKQFEKLCLADMFNCIKDKEGNSSSLSNGPSFTDIDFLPETNFKNNTDDPPKWRARS